MIPNIIPYRIVEPIKWQGKMWGAGQESKLRMAGWPPYMLQRAIKEGKVAPGNEDDSWYLGPHHLLFWDQGLFTEQMVWRRIRNGHARVWHLGTKRHREVCHYLKNRI